MEVGRADGDDGSVLWCSNTDPVGTTTLSPPGNPTPGVGLDWRFSPATPARDPNVALKVDVGVKAELRSEDVKNRGGVTVALRTGGALL